MRILVDCRAIRPGRSRGIENFAYCVIAGIARHVDNVVVDVAQTDRNFYSDLYRERRNVEIISDPVSGMFHRLAEASRVSNLAVRALGRLTRTFRFDPLARRASWARVQQADAVYYPFHGHPPQHAHLPMVTTIHAILPEYDERMMATIQAHVDSARAVVTSWPYPFDDLRERYGFNADRLFVVPFTVRQNVDAANDGEFADLGIPQSFYFYPAVIVERKNHLNLIRAYGKLHADGYSLTPVMCSGGGDAELKARLQREAAKLGVTDAFRFLGYVSKETMAALYARCRATISPTRWEAGMATLQEGGAAGKPAICSDIPPARAHARLLETDVCFFDPDDPNDIADKIRAFEHEFDRYAQSAQRVQSVINGFDEDYTGGCYAEILRYAAGKTSVPPWTPYKHPRDLTRDGADESHLARASLSQDNNTQSEQL